MRTGQIVLLEFPSHRGPQNETKNQHTALMWDFCANPLLVCAFSLPLSIWHLSCAYKMWHLSVTKADWLIANIRAHVSIIAFSCSVLILFFAEGFLQANLPFFYESRMQHVCIVNVQCSREKCSCSCSENSTDRDWPWPWTMNWNKNAPANFLLHAQQKNLAYRAGM